MSTKNIEYIGAVMGENPLSAEVNKSGYGYGGSWSTSLDKAIYLPEVSNDRINTSLLSFHSRPQALELPTASGLIALQLLNPGVTEGGFLPDSEEYFEQPIEDTAAAVIKNYFGEKFTNTDHPIVHGHHWISALALRAAVSIDVPTIFTPDMLGKFKEGIVSECSDTRFAIEQEALRITTAITVNTADELKRMVEFYAPDNNSSVSLEQKTEIIPPGINTRIFNPEYIAEDREAVRKSWGISDDEYVIVTGGRNRREKNFETVLHGFKRFFDLLPPNERSRVHLIVATGDNVKTDDPYITELLHALTTFSPEAQGKISFIAFQRYAPHLYAGADVFVAMSRLETFGSTVTEAMSCGLPVITSDIPSYEEQTAYRSQVNSLTIPVSSDERIMGNLLAQALQTTYTAYRSDDTALKDYSLERARPYSWRVSAVKLANLVQKIS